jgi:hypothetical protein
MDSRTMRVLQQSNEVGIQFLRTELDTGHTFLDIAQVTAVESTRLRTLENACRAYESIVRVIGRLELTREEDLELHGKLAELKRRLDSESRSEVARAPQEL